MAADIRPFEVTHGLVFRLAAPMTLAYLSVPLVGIIDTAIIGQLGDAALLGGIAVGAVVLSVVFTTFNFLRSGTTGLTAQAYGAGDSAETIAVLGRALIVAALSGLLILMLQTPLVAAGVLLMDPGASVALAMRQYLTIRIWASPFSLVNFALLGWLLGVGRSGTALGVQTLFAALNIVLSVWFVAGLDLGVAGVAWGAVLA
nr:MATE family efflux transporter [Hyphomicrobiales bacterium]